MDNENSPCYKSQPSGLCVSIRVTPNSSKSEITGVQRYDRDRLKVRIAAPPVDGSANLEVTRFFSKLLKIPKSAISIIRGQTSQNKEVLLPSQCEEKLIEVIQKCQLAKEQKDK